MQRSDIVNILMTLLVFCFMLVMIREPEIVFAGATRGLKLWWEILFASLLPFYITADLLIRLGFVRFIGSLLEPIMRRVFNVPGEGGFVIALSLTCGAPINAVVTTELRQQGLCTRLEAERLICFTTNTSLSFMLTTVAVGMFSQPEVGIVIASAHILANLLLGICLRFYYKGEQVRNSISSNWSFKQAVGRLVRHQRMHRKSLGELLGEAMATSIQKIMIIGGFIILFSVVIELFMKYGIISLLSVGLEYILIPLGFSAEMPPTLARGFFETTIGTNAVANSSMSQLEKLTAIGMMLGWSGFSIHAQVASMISDGDIKVNLFIISRLIHAVFAGCFTWLLYQPIMKLGDKTSQVTSMDYSMMMSSPLSILLSSFILFVLLLLLLILIALFFSWITKKA